MDRTADEGRGAANATSGAKAPEEPSRFRIRACPVCGRVDMPQGRDDRPVCKQPPSSHGGNPSPPRLAWFDVDEADTRANRLNAEARAAYVPRETPLWEYSEVGGRLSRRDPYSGDFEYVDPPTPGPVLSPARDATAPDRPEPRGEGPDERGL